MITIDNGKIARSMGVSGACKVFSVLLSFVYIPLVMEYLGEEIYGVWAAILSVLSWIEYMDIGIGNGLRNRLTEKLGEGDIKTARELISSAYMLLSFIMMGAVAVFAILSGFLDYKNLLNIGSYQEKIQCVFIVQKYFVFHAESTESCGTWRFESTGSGGRNICGIKDVGWKLGGGCHDIWHLQSGVYYSVQYFALP